MVDTQQNDSENNILQGTCRVCEETHYVHRKDNVMYSHSSTKTGEPCKGTGQPPIDEVSSHQPE